MCCWCSEKWANCKSCSKKKFRACYLSCLNCGIFCNWLFDSSTLVNIGKYLVALFATLAVSMGFIRSTHHIYGIYEEGQQYFADNGIGITSSFGALMSGLGVFGKAELLSIADHSSYTNGWYAVFGFLFVMGFHAFVILFASYCASKSIYILATILSVAVPFILVIAAYFKYSEKEPKFCDSFHWCCQKNNDINDDEPVNENKKRSCNCNSDCFGDCCCNIWELCCCCGCFRDSSDDGSNDGLNDGSNNDSKAEESKNGCCCFCQIAKNVTTSTSIDFLALLFATLALVSAMSVGGLALRNYNEDIFEFADTSCRDTTITTTYSVNTTEWNNATGGTNIYVTYNTGTAITGKTYFEEILTACFVISISGLKIYDGKLPEKSKTFRILLFIVLLVPVITLIFYVFLRINEPLTAFTIFVVFICLIAFALSKDLYDEMHKKAIKMSEQRKQRKAEKLKQKLEQLQMQEAGSSNHENDENDDNDEESHHSQRIDDDNNLNDGRRRKGTKNEINIGIDLKTKEHSLSHSKDGSIQSKKIKKSKKSIATVSKKSEKGKDDNPIIEKKESVQV